MAFQFQRPALIGVAGVTIGAWLLEFAHPSATHWGEMAIWAGLALAGTWFINSRRNSVEVEKFVVPVNREAVDKALAHVSMLIGQLAQEQVADVQSLVNLLQERLVALKQDAQRQNVRVAIAGASSSGKSTLVQRLNELLTDAQVWSVADGDAPNQPADLLLFVTAGDLTEPEFQTLQTLINQKRRVLLVFNKQDRYLPEEQPLILQQLRERVQSFMLLQDVVAIIAQPAPIKVRQHQADGTVAERMEQPEANVVSLTNRMIQLKEQLGERLILETVLYQAEVLKADVLAKLNQIRRARALPLIEQSQWVAAAAAFATPVPSLDLLATAAINAQLVADLGTVYQQQFSLDQAKEVAKTLAEQMVKLGLVEMSSQAIAPLLKSHALTFVAGGLLQGISAAYLTRIAGLSLVEYFQEQSQFAIAHSESSFQIGKLTQKLKAVFHANQRTAFVQSLVQQGIAKLVPAAPEAGKAIA